MDSVALVPLIGIFLQLIDITCIYLCPRVNSNSSFNLYTISIKTFSCKKKHQFLRLMFFLSVFVIN
jgi:hypothetical protein